MTLSDLASLLSARNAQSLVVQFFAGEWQATVRTAQGIGPQGRGETILEAIERLVVRLQS